MSDWQPIATCPKSRIVLLFAVTDRDEHGTVKNWKMRTGSWSAAYDSEAGFVRNHTPWMWDGEQLHVFDTQPTHWMALPEPPYDLRAALDEVGITVSGDGTGGAYSEICSCRKIPCVCP